MMIILLLQASLVFADWNEETKYQHMLEGLHRGEVITCIDSCYEDYGLFLNALDTFYEETKPEYPLNVPLYPDSGLIIGYYMILKDHFTHLPIPEEIYETIDQQIATDADALVPILQDLAESDPFFLRYITWVQNQRHKDFSIEIDSAKLKSLVNDPRQLDIFKNGQYKDGIQLFKFCRAERAYPCRIIVKDSKGNFARQANGKLWSIPSLGMAKNRKPYYKVSGNTPSGIYTIDGVMPQADQPISYGKYRRLILNFIPRSVGERNHLQLLPSTHHTLPWWKEGVTARQVGRNLIRIHGTGKKVTSPQDTFYTFAPTQGCINTRENTYEEVTYKDQRDLLDTIMKSMGLSATYDNEANIYGLLYVINVDNKMAPITEQDLEAWGIK